MGTRWSDPSLFKTDEEPHHLTPGCGFRISEVIKQVTQTVTALCERLHDQLFHRASADPQTGGDVGMAQPVELVHEENLSLPGRQVSDDRFQTPRADENRRYVLPKEGRQAGHGTPPS